MKQYRRTELKNLDFFYFLFRQAAFIVPTPNMSGRYNALSRRRGSPMKKLQNNHKLGQTDDLRKCDLTKSFAQPKEWEYPNSPQEKTKSQYFSHWSLRQPGLTSKCALGPSVHTPKRGSFTIMALKLWDSCILFCLLFSIVLCPCHVTVEFRPVKH